MKRVITDLSNWMSLTLLVQKRLERNPKPFVVTLTTAPKTWQQLGYLHSQVLPVLAEALHDAGEIRNKSEREAKYWLKVQIGYGAWIEFRDGVVFDADSFEKADIEVLTKAIDAARYEAEQRGYFVPPPKDRRCKS